MRRIIASLLAVVALPFSDAIAGEKTDLVFLNNGDRITCEIQQLNRGILQVKTDDIGTVNVEWEDVDSLSSGSQFRVEEAAGTKHFGTLLLTRADVLRISEGGQVWEAAQLAVVEIVPVEASYWQQLDGFINLGFSYTKSKGLSQFTTNIAVSRTTDIRMLSLEFTSILTAEDDEETRRRVDATLSYARLFEGPPFAIATASAQRNDELGLRLRLLISVGGGAYFVASNHNQLAAALGLSANQEQSDVSTDKSYHLDAFLTVVHSVFRHDYPKTDISTQITLYPGLSTWGSLRAEVDISASREIVKDLNIVLSFYDSYDNQPADPSSPENDYGIVTSLGWTF
jgi:Protein of unknown function, DUF481